MTGFINLDKCLDIHVLIHLDMFWGIDKLFNLHFSHHVHIFFVGSNRTASVFQFWTGAEILKMSTPTLVEVVSFHGVQSEEQRKQNVLK